eukprot:gnl/TRDRNA2_/TRDRNA2_177534_c2_seq19.p2 gnl/TRDRNA2_/TRDRNA2_177534_c2~~gnl/TRDRNA2_/TRDRNA2_177534_c2_seq19.p2  ORF type:complete len:269 (+),score=72.90 gnl/TRDRNA2_/TRDRNA2_177534_c2_seq19:1775-2581(+)
MDKLYKLVQMEFDVDLDEYIKGCQNKDVSGLDGLPTGKHYKCSHGGGSALERPRSYPLYCDGRKIDKEMPENELFDGRSSDNTPLTPDFDEDKETIEVDPDHEFIVLQVGWFNKDHAKAKVDGQEITKPCNTLMGSGWYWLRSDTPGALLVSGDGPENAFEAEFSADEEEPEPGNDEEPEEQSEEQREEAEAVEEEEEREERTIGESIQEARAALDTEEEEKKEANIVETIPEAAIAPNAQEGSEAAMAAIAATAADAEAVSKGGASQ